MIDFADDKLDGDDLIAAHLASGRSKSATARICNISKHAIFERLKKPEFQAKVAHYRRLLVEDVLNWSGRLMRKCMKRHFKLVDSVDEEVASKAVFKGYEISLRLREINDIEGRLGELEQSVLGKKSG